MLLKTNGVDARIANLTVGQMLGDLRGDGNSVAVTNKSVRGLTAFGRAVSIAAEAVAKRKLAVWRGEGGDQMRVSATWQARFFAGVPHLGGSWFSLLEATEASLTGRNNAFWLKIKDSASVSEVRFIPRDNVEARWNSEAKRPEYRIRVSAASWSDWLNSSSILHFHVGHVDPGCLIAPSSVELYRDALKAALSKVRYEGNAYDRGLLESLAVTFPGEIKPEQIRRYKELIESEHGGIDKSAGVRVFGGGATVEKIGISLSDAQFIDSMNFDLEQVARMTRMWASLIGGTAGAAVRTAPLPEHEEDRWWRYGLEPRLIRIEETIKADPDFFGPAARDYPAFLPSRVRADRATEIATQVALVQAGIVLPDTAAAELGYPVLPDGAGQIPQVTPVGGAPNDPAVTP